MLFDSFIHYFYGFFSCVGTRRNKGCLMELSVLRIFPVCFCLPFIFRLLDLQNKIDYLICKIVTGEKADEFDGNPRLRSPN